MTNTIVDELGRIPMSPFLGATLSRAAAYADAQGHLQVTIEHLLLALTEDPEATVVLKSSNIDIARLSADVSAQLGRIEERANGGPHDVVMSGDLKRILEAAAAAASQGRRREINGAIVLAAIVGEGRSTSAHMLRAQGMTFEEAIRALQRSQLATAQAPAATRPGQPSADDILAAARERVQTRTQPGSRDAPRPVPAALPMNNGAAVEESFTALPEPMSVPAHPAPTSYEPKWEPAPIPESNAQEPKPYYVEEKAAASPPPAPAPVLERASPPPRPSPQPMPQAHPAAPSLPPQASPQQWAPPPMQQPGPAAPRGPARMPPPLPMNAPLPGGPPQGAALQFPPPPLGAPPPYRPAPQQAAPPWSEGGDARSAGRRPEGVGAAAEPPRNLSFDPRQRPQQRPAQAPPPGDPRLRLDDPRRRQQGPMVQAGQLVENIPRRMRVAIPMIVEARIARAEVKAIADTMQGGGAIHRHEVMVSKAMTVRLRAPDGGFSIETASPETQWIDNVLGVMADDYASWRWSITPKERGKKRLQLVVSARTVGADGLMAETALPDQVIEVKVGVNYAKTAVRWAGWITAASVGGILARFGEEAYVVGREFVARVMGG